jgi:hypothetical protein
MDALFPDWLKLILLGMLGTFYGLSWLARKHPDVGWLQVFQLPTIQRSEEERARQRRFSNRMAAVEMILAGLVLPLLYALSTVMMMNNFHTLPTIIVLACSALCIGFGIWLLVRNR